MDIAIAGSTSIIDDTLHALRLFNPALNLVLSIKMTRVTCSLFGKSLYAILGTATIFLKDGKDVAGLLNLTKTDYQ